jgi:uncharacterized DUF497 family protein
LLLHYVCTIANGIQFEWDANNVEHIALHNVAPEEAEQVLLGETVDLEPQDVDSEERFPSVGVTDAGRFLIATVRGDKIRVVTAFDAPKGLVALYLNERG